MNILERDEEMHNIYKRLVFYVLGLFLLALGVSFSIVADFGVSPVSALAYALSLTTGFTVGVMTLVANFLYIIIQAILNKRFEWREFLLQMVISFLFGLFINITLSIFHIVLPATSNVVIRSFYLLCSLIIIAFALLFYFMAKLPVMPYDGMIYAINDFFNWKMSKSKIIGDMINVIFSGAICVIFIHQLGAIGIGTIVSVVFIGKILGILMKKFQNRLINWINKSNPSKTHAV